MRCGSCSDETCVVFGVSILGGVLWIDVCTVVGRKQQL